MVNIQGPYATTQSLKSWHKKAESINIYHSFQILLKISFSLTPFFVKILRSVDKYFRWFCNDEIYTVTFPCFLMKMK